tara:strand:+ start:792 stop:1919 length:1128 start_codon:yes stop_codon:yes gene_type:complete
MELQIIHIILGKANPNRMNGVNKVVNSLAESQAQLGMNVTVWGITKNLVHDYPNRSYNTQLFKDTGKFSIDPNLRAEIEASKDLNVIFHFHGGFIPQFNPIAKLIIKNKLKYVFTPHGAFNTVALERSKWKKKAYILLLESFLVKNAKHTHLIGESEVIGTTSIFGAVPYELIPNGQEITSATTLNDSKIGNSAPVFGFVGRLDTHTKGLDTLLESFAKIVSNNKSSSELWLIGDGPDRANLEKMAQKLHISNHMKFLGAKYGSEKDQLVKQLDFLCLVSRNEGLPGVVLEAASEGVPVIVSKETNLAHYITKSNAGFVATENTSTGVARALEQALSSIQTKEFHVLRKNARKMIETHFDWSVIAKHHIDSYESN